MNRIGIQFVEEKRGTEIVHITKIIENRKRKVSESEDHGRMIRERGNQQQKCTV